MVGFRKKIVLYFPGKEVQQQVQATLPCGANQIDLKQLRGAYDAIRRGD